MPIAGASLHSRCPVIKSAVFCAVGLVIVVAYGVACFYVEIFRHPILCADSCGLIGFVVAGIGESAAVTALLLAGTAGSAEPGGATTNVTAAIATTNVTAAIATTNVTAAIATAA